jgi:pimeloyl-ACP methyl ester carboxylesterase
VAGRERAYFDFFFDFLGSKAHPLPDAVRERFAAAYRRPEALKAGFDWYRTFEADAKRNEQPKAIETPILYFRGDADGRSADDYAAGLRAAGARDLHSETLAGTAEFTPIEAPERFAGVIARFADYCAAEESSLV